MNILFPESKIIVENLFGLINSIIAIKTDGYL